MALNEWAWVASDLASMSPFPPWIKHGLWLVPLLGGFTILGFAWQASRLLVSPKRRPLQDYHQIILKDPAAHGMRLRSFATTHPDKTLTPCLICEPTSTPSLKGQRVRDQLAQRDVRLPRTGTVIGTLVLAHGHSGRKEDHLPVAERLCAAGFRCLLFDVPGHGDHPKPFTTFGLTEARLPKAVLDGAAACFDFSPTQACLFGVSEGGAIILQAAAHNPEAWLAVGELSSFATLSQVIRHEARRFGPFANLTAVVMQQMVKHRANYDPSQIRPIDAVAVLQTMPVLIGHGDADRFVTPNNAHELFAACPSPRKQFLSIPGASHGRVFVTEAPVYATLCQFFLEAMEATPVRR